LVSSAPHHRRVRREHVAPSPSRASNRKEVTWCSPPTDPSPIEVTVAAVWSATSVKRNRPRSSSRALDRVAGLLGVRIRPVDLPRRFDDSAVAAAAIRGALNTTFRSGLVAAKGRSPCLASNGSCQRGLRSLPCSHYCLPSQGSEPHGRTPSKERRARQRGPGRSKSPVELKYPVREDRVAICPSEQ